MWGAVKKAVRRATLGRVLGVSRTEFEDLRRVVQRIERKVYRGEEAAAKAAVPPDPPRQADPAPVPEDPKDWRTYRSPFPYLQQEKR